ncbi:MAG: NADH-quinone oxidoreductase subunit J [Candidatus Tectomicrobia bacterium]|uniref:NADH-quinone oxidoreductase subunit J n=1 Tax=Tectimicrobiota bacterium TaxID=2528274 RepID=A0A937W138_UNCTE|nr:NADH-quinone oxidoreductase subunit J [Candidatus Tectomicrobia bacterium]
MGMLSLGALHYWLVACLLLIGLHSMLAQRNLLKKLMAMNIMQVAVIVFFIALAAKTGGTVPIDTPSIKQVDAYINPLPHALMLTAIVVGVSTTGVALALLIRLYRRYGTLEEPEVLAQLMESA